MRKTECASPRLLICPTVMLTRFNIFRGAEKLHSDRTNMPSAPYVPGPNTVW